MGKKRRKRRRRRSNEYQEKLVCWSRSLQERVVSFTEDPKAKRVLTAVLVVITLPLLGLFGVLGDQIAFYALILTSVSLGLLVWAFPNVRLALASLFLFTQPLLIFMDNSSYSYTKIVYSLWFISILMVVWAAALALRRRAEVHFTALMWPALLLLVSALLSLVNSESFLADFQYIVVLVYFVLFYLFLVNTISSPEHIRYLVGALLVSAVLAALHGLSQYYGVTPGVRGSLSGGSGAMLSTFGNPNFLGGFLAYLYAPGLLLLLFSKTSWARLFTIASLAIFYTSYMAIDSDSVWLAWLVSLAVIALGVILTRRWAVLFFRWKWIAALVAVTLLFAAGFQFGSYVMEEPAKGARVAPELSSTTPFLQRAQAFAESPSLFLQAAGTLRTRLENWLIGYEMFKRHPVVGVGLGDYKREFLPYKATFHSTELGKRFEERIGYTMRAEQAHNEYVQIGAEMGVLGLLATGIFIAFVVYRAVGRLRWGEKAEVQWTALLLFAGIAAFMSDSLFSFPLHLPGNALALVALLGALHSGALGEPRIRLAFGSRAARAAAVVLLIVAMTATFFAYRDWLADLYLATGEVLMSVGDPRGEKFIERSIELDFAPGEAFYWLGSFHAWRGQPQVATRYLEQAHPVFKTEFNYYVLALVNYRQRNFDAMRQYLETLRAMDPHELLAQEADYLHAVTISQQGRSEEALAIFQSLLEAGYQPVKIHINIAEVFIQMDEQSRAVSHLRQAQTLIEEELAELDVKPLASDEVSSADFQNPDQLRQYELVRLRTRVRQLLDQLGE